MAENTASNPALIKDQVASLLIRPLEAESVVLSSGVRIFDSAEPLRIPRLVSGSAPAFVAEGALIPDNADVNFDEIVLMPTERASIKTILRFTNELVRASAIGLDAVLKDRLVRDVTNLLDQSLLTGNGANDSITGIINQPGVQAGALALTGDGFLDALAMAAAAEVKPNRWFMNGADFIAVRKVKDTNGRYLLESDITKDATYRLFGVPVTVTNKLPAGKAVLADTAQIAVVRDVNPSVTVLNERYAEFDQVGLRVVTRYDVGVLNPDAVIVLSA